MWRLRFLKKDKELTSGIQLVGESFVGVAFMRNVFSVGILFALNPWMEAQGLQNMTIVMGCWCFTVCALYIPMIYYGKKLRVKTAGRYMRLAASSQVSRR
jgi:hypothetical protein